MKILGLTMGRLFAALVFGLLIAFTITYVTVPHPVEVPVQVITPVPTPPPVVITEHPTLSEVWNEPMSEINETLFVAFNLIPVILAVVAITMVLFVLGGISGGRD